MRSSRYLSMIACFMAVVLILAGCGSNAKGPAAATKQAAETTQASETAATGDKKKTITLKFATALPTTHPFSVAAEQPFMKRVTELTNGQVQWEWYPAEQLGKAADTLGLTSTGVTDLGYIVPSYTPSEMPLGSALIGVPGLFETADEGSAALFNVAHRSPMLETDYLKNGVRPVFNMATPTYDIFTNGKEIKVPDDLKGFKIRASGGVLSEALAFAGAVPVQLPTPDIFGAIDKGVINGIHLYSTVIEAFKMRDLISYATRNLNFSGGGVGFIINEKVYQGLPKNVQDAIMQAGQEVSLTAGAADQRVNNETFDKWAQAGKIKIYQVSAEEKAKWQALYDGFSESWKKKQNSEDFNKVYNSFKEEVDKYRAAKK